MRRSEAVRGKRDQRLYKLEVTAISVSAGAATAVLAMFTSFGMPVHGGSPPVGVAEVHSAVYALGWVMAAARKCRRRTMGEYAASSGPKGRMMTLLAVSTELPLPAGSTTTPSMVRMLPMALSGTLP